jgi:hypothetical protein
MTVRRVIAHHISIAVETLLFPTRCAVVAAGGFASGHSHGQKAQQDCFPKYRSKHFEAPFPIVRAFYVKVIAGRKQSLLR